MQVNHPIISADSHIAEAPNTYTDYIDPQWRDVAPHVVETEDKGDLYVIDGMKRTINMGLIAAAGQAPEDLKPTRNGKSYLEVDGIRTTGWQIRIVTGYRQR